MSTSNKELVQRMFAAWSAGDVDGVCNCIGDECNGGGPEGLRRELTGFLGAFPNLSITVEDILAEDDRVATRTIMRGTHNGPLGNIPATGKDVVMRANHIFRCSNGRIVQRHGQMDRLEVMTQLGMRLAPIDEDSM